MATLGFHTFDQGCDVRCDCCDSQSKVLVDIKSVSGFCFYCHKGTECCLRQVCSAVSDKYVVLNRKITLVTACLASVGATLVL